MSMSQAHIRVLRAAMKYRKPGRSIKETLDKARKELYHPHHSKGLHSKHSAHQSS